MMFFLVFIVEMFITGVMFSLIGFEEDSHKLKDLFDQIPMISIFLLAVVVAPIAEEIIFRFFLRYPLILMGLFGVCLFLLITYLYSITYINTAIMIISLLVTLGILIWIIRNESIQENIENWFINYFGFVFYGSVVIFAYVHIFNFGDIGEWYYTPILVLPQFTLALYLGYIRVRNSIWASIYIHALNNSIPMTLMLMFPDAV